MKKLTYFRWCDVGNADEEAKWTAPWPDYWCAVEKMWGQKSFGKFYELYEDLMARSSPWLSDREWIDAYCAVEQLIAEWWERLDAIEDLEVKSLDL